MKTIRAWMVVSQKRSRRLKDCPIGMFVSANGELCVMTEYFTNGKRDAYIVSTGEYFWGGTSDKTARDMLMVTPVEIRPVRKEDK